MQLAAVYSREIDGQILQFSASGWTYRSTFVLYDYETESLWYHLEGEDSLTCINGEYADRKVPELTAGFLRWNNWRELHPQTKILDTFN